MRCDRQTDRQTDEQTIIVASFHSARPSSVFRRVTYLIVVYHLRFHSFCDRRYFTLVLDDNYALGLILKYFMADESS